MAECECLELVRLEGEYLRFIVDTHIELNKIEHILECDLCKKSVKEALESNETVPLGIDDLFSFSDPEAPGAEEYASNLGYVEACLAWRLGYLKKILERASTELEDLRNRLS